jgi:hypothetical protein
MQARRQELLRDWLPQPLLELRLPQVQRRRRRPH